MDCPTPNEIRKARMDAGLSQTEAAKLLHKGLKTWQNWEAHPVTSSHRKMDPALWELFNIKIGKSK